MDGTHRGFEDFCVLNGRRTDENYRGTYEASEMKRFGQFANSTRVGEEKRDHNPTVVAGWCWSCVNALRLAYAPPESESQTRLVRGPPITAFFRDCFALRLINVL